MACFNALKQSTTIVIIAHAVIIVVSLLRWWLFCASDKFQELPGGHPKEAWAMGPASPLHSGFGAQRAHVMLVLPCSMLTATHWRGPKTLGRDHGTSGASASLCIICWWEWYQQPLGVRNKAAPHGAAMHENKIRAFGVALHCVLFCRQESRGPWSHPERSFAQWGWRPTSCCFTGMEPEDLGPKLKDRRVSARK
jgi:hypothetical protein